jgi:spore germination protein YaaH
MVLDGAGRVYPEGHTVFYQDHRSIGAKVDVLVREHPKVGGAAVWHVGGEDQRYWDTIRSKLGRELGRHRRRTRSP